MYISINMLNAYVYTLYICIYISFFYLTYTKLSIKPPGYPGSVPRSSSESHLGSADCYPAAVHADAGVSWERGLKWMSWEDDSE